MVIKQLVPDANLHMIGCGNVLPWRPQSAVDH
jgi:hypothetical protein